MLDPYRSVSGICVRLLVLVCALSAVAAADTCVAAGMRPGGGPGFAPAFNPIYIASGQPGFGVSGPKDQDDGSMGNPDMTDDMCMTLTFNVPAAAAQKKGAGGWGGLTLTFSTPIDGGSFIYDPVCPNPQDGAIGQVAPGGEPTIGPNQSITFKPLVGNKPYYVLPTNTPVGLAGGTNYANSQAPNYSQFVVTIMYDASQGTPQLLANDLVGGPASFWVGKPGMQNGGFSPYPGTNAPGVLGIDYFPATPTPEPSYLSTLMAGFFGLAISAYRKRGRSAPADVTRS